MAVIDNTRLIASVRAYGTQTPTVLTLFNAQGQQQHTLTQLSSPAPVLALSFDAGIAALGARNGDIQVVPVDNPSAAKLLGANREVEALEFSPSGESLSLAAVKSRSTGRRI